VHVDRSIIFDLLIMLAISGVTAAEGASCTLVSAPDTDPEYFTRWASLFEESERLERTVEGKSYNGPMLRAHNAFYGKVFANCQAGAKESGEVLFLAIAVVSKTGVIEQFLTMPPKTEYQCFVDGIVGQTYPPPPTDHYPVGFLVAFDDPTGTPVEDCARKVLGSLYEKFRAPNNRVEPAQ
jgi:hypothetical protein